MSFPFLVPDGPRAPLEPDRQALLQDRGDPLPRRQIGLGDHSASIPLKQMICNARRRVISSSQFLNEPAAGSYLKPWMRPATLMSVP